MKNMTLREMVQRDEECGLLLDVAGYVATVEQTRRTAITTGQVVLAARTSRSPRAFDPVTS